MNVLALPLGTTIWHWDWDGTDDTIAEYHPPIFRADVAEWANVQRIKYSLDIGDDAPDGDNVMNITFDNEDDLRAFRAKWC